MRGHALTRSATSIMAASVLATGAACSDNETLSEPMDPATAVSQSPPPAPLANIDVVGGSLRSWVFTGTTFDGVPNNPMNLVFTGDASPVAIRATLRALDGDRTAFGLPPVPPFNCTWDDAIGGMETAWTDLGSWTSNPVQLQCGDYGPIRFHLRLFPAGPHTVANAHFEILIPGTTEHQVISWELAEQLVIIDMLRSGMLAAAPAPTGVIHPAPGYREIPALIYNGLPVELRAAIGGPLGDVGADVPIGTDGSATVLTIGQNAAIVSESRVYDFTIPFDQVIPRPFCNDGNDFVYVQGAVDFFQRVDVDAGGHYEMSQTADGELTITPINPLNGQPLGPSYGAHVSNLHESVINEAGVLVNARVSREELSPGSASQRTQLTVTPGGVATFRMWESC